jgi:DNA-binding transcriptional LysR family regulator
LQPFGVNVSTALETNYLETIKMMVSVGLGWSALPGTMIDSDIVEVSTPQLHMQRQLGSVRLKGRTLSRAALAFLTMLETEHS